MTPPGLRRGQQVLAVGLTLIFQKFLPDLAPCSAEQVAEASSGRSLRLSG